MKTEEEQVEMNQCRLCTSYEQKGLVKYSVRHYAHLECALAKWGVKFLDRLTPWQISQLPFLPLYKRPDCLAEARKRCKEPR